MHINTTFPGNRTYLTPCLAIMSFWMTALVGSPASAQSGGQVDAVVLDEMAKRNIVGMAVGIVKNGKIY